MHKPFNQDGWCGVESPRCIAEHRVTEDCTPDDTVELIRHEDFRQFPTEKLTQEQLLQQIALTLYNDLKYLGKRTQGMAQYDMWYNIQLARHEEQQTNIDLTQARHPALIKQVLTEKQHEENHATTEPATNYIPDTEGPCGCVD